MSFHNPDLPWWELERILSGRPGPHRHLRVVDPLAADDSERPPRQPPAMPSPAPVEAGRVPYAELHAHTNFSFLDGASHPRGAGRGGGPAGADRAGGHRPRRLLRRGALRRGGPGRWGCPPSSARSCPWAAPARATANRTRPAGTCWCSPTAPRGTPGCRRPSPAPSCAAGRRAARTTASWSRSPPSCATTCWSSPAAARARAGGAAHRGVERGGPGAGPADRALRRRDGGGGADRPRRTRSTPTATTRSPSWPPRAGLPTVATGNVHYATPGRRRLATTAGRGPGPAQPRRDRRLAARRRPPPTCAAARRWRPGSPRTRARWRGPPSSAPNSPSTCTLVAPRLPAYPVPPGHTEMSWLRQLTMDGALERYGPRAGAPAGVPRSSTTSST